jgi:site-specific recombinase XerD
MPHRYISQFIEYCRLADFSIRSIQALTTRLNEFKAYLKLQKIRSVKKITYPHLIDFVADFNNPAKEPADFQTSIHVRKSLVWTLSSVIFSWVWTTLDRSDGIAPLTMNGDIPRLC